MFTLLFLFIDKKSISFILNHFMFLRQRNPNCFLSLDVRVEIFMKLTIPTEIDLKYNETTKLDEFRLNAQKQLSKASVCS